MGLEEGPRPYFRVVKGGSRGGVVNFIVRNTGRLGAEGRGGGRFNYLGFGGSLTKASGVSHSTLR